jgi:hypothetical protein
MTSAQIRTWWEAVKITVAITDPNLATFRTTIGYAQYSYDVQYIPLEVRMGCDRPKSEYLEQ